MTDQIQIFHFFCQFLLNYIDDKKIKSSWMFKQKTKNALKTFYGALEDQMCIWLRGDIKRELDGFNSEILRETNQGVMAIEEYFNVLFALPHLSPEELEAFQKEYYELLEKYNLKTEILK